MRLVVGVTGASGTIYAIRLMDVLREHPEIEIHLVLTDAAKVTLVNETDFTVKQVEDLAHVRYDNADIGAAISSGSFRTDGMLIVPCSINTLSGVANSVNSNLLIRAADVTLKERRRLVLMVRETPLHLGHLRLMAQATEIGAILFPPIPAMYHRPKSVEQIVDHSIGRMLDLFNVEHKLFQRWKGTTR